jgi:hypothetical protein
MERQSLATGNAGAGLNSGQSVFRGVDAVLKEIIKMAAPDFICPGPNQKLKVGKVAKCVTEKILIGFVLFILCVSLTACDSPAAGEPPLEIGGTEDAVNISDGAALTEEEAALMKIFEAAMPGEGDLPGGYAWQGQKDLSGGKYRVIFTSSGGNARPITIEAYLMPAEEHSTMTAEEYFSYNYEEMLSDQSVAYTGLPLAYILFNDISVYDEEEAEAGLVFLKNGLYEGSVTVKGRELDYGFCEEEAVRLGSLIWERLAD